MSNVRVIGSYCIDTSWLRYFVGFGGNTPYALVNRDTESYKERIEKYVESKWMIRYHLEDQGWKVGLANTYAPTGKS